MKQFSHVSGVPSLPKIIREDTDHGRYYHTPTGNKYPSITTILGYFKSQGLLDWRKRIGEEKANDILHRAGIRGTKLHNLIEKYLRNEPDLYKGIMPDMKTMFLDMKRHIDKIDNIQYIECPLYSDVLGTAGTADTIGRFDRVLSVIDYKSSLKEKKEEYITNYFEQASAYAIMYEERTNIPIDQIVIMIGCDGSNDPQVFIKQKKDYIDSLNHKIRAYKEAHDVL